MTQTVAASGESVEMAGVRAGYGPMTVLQDVQLAVGAGESLGIIGPNGAGKTTLLKALAGLVPLTAGTVRVGGVQFGRLPTHERVARGLALVPEGRQVIGGLTVQANLDITVFARRRMRLDAEHASRVNEVFELFPVLHQRRLQMASSLSGGEQQMLAFGRALMTRPRVLLVDEPTQGLAPRIVDQVADLLVSFKGSMTMVVVEQHHSLLDRVADRIVTMRFGQLIDGTAQG